MLEIQHIPKCFIIYQGDLVDTMNGVAKDTDQCAAFFKKALSFADGSNDTSSSTHPHDEPAASKSGLIVDKLN